MICCENCLINPICKIGCEELLKNKNLITIEDFKKYVNLPKRLMTTGKEFTLKFKHNIQVKINCNSCAFTKNGERHRVDGPAIEYASGEKHWYKNGKRHREDGPAIEYTNGDKYWYINGIKNGIKMENFNEKMVQLLSMLVDIKNGI